MVLSSSVKPGTHFLENNKIIGVFTISKLGEQRTISAVTLHVERDTMCATKIKQVFLVFWGDDVEIGHFRPQSMMLSRSKIHSM